MECIKIVIFQGLFISSDTTSTSTSIAATGSYYSLTKSVAAALPAMFQAAFPKWFEKYKVAFDTGVWFEDDRGPLLGRAVINKLQGSTAGTGWCFPQKNPFLDMFCDF